MLVDEEVYQKHSNDAQNDEDYDNTGLARGKVGTTSNRDNVGALGVGERRRDGDHFGNLENHQAVSGRCGRSSDTEPVQANLIL